MVFQRLSGLHHHLLRLLLLLLLPILFLQLLLLLPILFLLQGCPAFTSLYRTADGSCNNPERPLWGSAFVPFLRFLPPDYRCLTAPRVCPLLISWLTYEGSPASSRTRRASLSAGTGGNWHQTSTGVLTF